MNLQQLKDQLTIDEGIRYQIYLDSKGLPTCGIGHLITKNDPEFKMKIGSKVSIKRVQELFLEDIEECLKDCRQCFKDFDNFSEELKQILANMLFNLGLIRFREFRRFIIAIENKDYRTAAKEMIDSVWYTQVGNRAKRLHDRMIALANYNIEYAKV